MHNISTVPILGAIAEHLLNDYMVTLNFAVGRTSNPNDRDFRKGVHAFESIHEEFSKLRLFEFKVGKVGGGAFLGISRGGGHAIIRDGSNVGDALASRGRGHRMREVLGRTSIRDLHCWKGF